MVKIGDFLKTTFLGGVIAIVPLSAVAFVLWSIFGVILDVVSAMEGVLRFSPLVNTLILAGIALAGLVLLCFVAGLALRTTIGNRAKDWVDGLLERFVPLYGAAKRLTSHVAGDTASEFTPAEVDLHGTGARVIGFVVEELPDERVAVFVPWTPMPSFGQVYLLAASQVEPFDAPLPDVIGPITDWGAGAERLMRIRT